MEIALKPSSLGRYNLSAGFAGEGIDSAYGSKTVGIFSFTDRDSTGIEIEDSGRKWLLTSEFEGYKSDQVLSLLLIPIYHLLFDSML
jgi:hypothetical protein